MTAARSISAVVAAAFVAFTPVAAELSAAESVWLEAEHFRGIRGYCWPGMVAEKTKTDGAWGISGPGWAAEWIQGGESNFMSIACGAEDDRAAAEADVEIPEAGEYRVWVRFRDNRGGTSRFNVRLTSADGATATLSYGTRPIIEEDNEMKLYWNWAFAWEAHSAKLAKGKAKIELLSAFKEKHCRQIDCIVLTNDVDYRPLIKERPRHPTWDVLAAFSQSNKGALEPLARRTGDWSVPAEWKPKTFRDKGFLYLWNMNHTKWASADPKRVPHPYHVADKDTTAAFEKEYAGAAEVPIFSDPRIVPIFHGSGPYILQTDDKDAKKKKSAEEFVGWLAANPDRPWGLMMNYHADNALTMSGKENFAKVRERFVGNVAGESLGYFYPPAQEMKKATAAAKTRRELVEAFTPITLATNAAKYRKVFGPEWNDNRFEDVISCKSIGMTAFAPLLYPWGARTVGYESSAITAGLLSMRMAFLRGAARQNGGMTATYRSCNFGDASTIFSEQSSFTKPSNILDNYYSVFSGAGMTWYKMDIWHQYMAGASMFYHEQGFDEFWTPGGTAAAGRHPLSLSPKGKLVDRFLRVTREHPQRGSPFTPVAFLLDYAHGWEASPFAPHAFGGWGDRTDLTLYGDHEQMIREYLWTAYYPIGPKGTEPTTAINEVYVPGVFGDVFDVVYAYPDVRRWTTIDGYRAVVAAGDIELTAAEGARLAAYIENGGTLVVADGHLTGAGVSALKLPERGAAAEANEYLWTPTNTKTPAQRFRYRPIAGGRALATAAGGPLCSAFDRGKGRLIVLSVPRGMGIDRTAVPVVAQLLAHLTRGVMPVQVAGDVEWSVNATDGGWIVTLMNPAGQAKPQQGITPTDYRENRTVTIQVDGKVIGAADWLFPEEKLVLKHGDGGPGAGTTLTLTVPAGAVRIVELRAK